MINDDNAAIICYVDAEEGQRYWRIDRMGLVLSRKAMDRHVTSRTDDGWTIAMNGRWKIAVACQWPSGNTIYRDMVETWKGIRD
jgi:hypothetical protein